MSPTRPQLETKTIMPTYSKNASTQLFTCSRSGARLILSLFFSGGHAVKPPIVVERRRSKYTCGEHLLFGANMCRSGQETDGMTGLHQKYYIEADLPALVERASTFGPGCDLGGSARTYQNSGQRTDAVHGT